MKTFNEFYEAIGMGVTCTGYLFENNTIACSEDFDNA